MFIIYSIFRYFGTVTSAMITNELEYPVLSSNDSVSDHVCSKTYLRIMFIITG